MATNGWCPHAPEGKLCLPCEEQSRKAQARIRKLHGPKCTCAACDYDDYWRHLGKQ